MVTLSGAQRERFWRTVERDAVAEPVLPMSKTGEPLGEAVDAGAGALSQGKHKLRHATLTELVA